MPSTDAATRILHLGSDPSDLALLLAELQADGLVFDIARARSEAELRAALEADAIALIVADLPLPWEGAARCLADVQRTHPDVGVVFRSGSTGNRTVTESVLPTARAVRAALDQRRAHAQPTDQDRRALLERVVRNQEAHLRLARRDLWSFDEAIRDITRTAAQVLDVRRVSLWEVDPLTHKLNCALVFDRELGLHDTKSELELGQRYLAALEESMFISAPDARHDPRTSEFAAGYLEPLGISSLLDAPVRRAGKIVGVVCHEHVGPQRQWSILDQCAAASIADIVARALEVRDRRRAEERLRESEKFEVIGRLAGRVAHDFNNLLTIIVGNAELGMMRCGANAPESSGLAQIGQAAEDAGALIRQLLSYARREPVRARRIDIVAHVEEMRGLVQRLLGQDVRVRFELCASPLWVALDPTRLQQVLLNLTANARDAMPQGGDFVLTLERGMARAPGQQRPSAHARLCVRDSGAGIDAQTLPRIFEPFFTTKSAKVGTGLGLSSVAEIVRQAGGQVSVSSPPGEGASFEILLPELQQQGETAKGEAARSALPGPALPNGQASVLLVEAEPNVRRVLRMALAQSGQQVVEAGEAVEALELYARGAEFDWILTDQVLPKMDGTRLIQHLRDFRPGLPAILIADFGACSDEQLDALRRTGQTLLLAKPLTPRDLQAALASLRVGL